MEPGASLGCGGEGGGEDMNLPLYPPPLETTLGKVNIVIFSGKNSFFAIVHGFNFKWAAKYKVA